VRAAVVLALLAGCSANTYVVAAPDPLVAVQTALEHTVFLDDLGCTGVAVGGGKVYTAQHCVDHLDVGAETPYGKLAFSSAVSDYAYLMDATNMYGPRACIRKPLLGEHVYAVGYPTNVLTEKQELNITDGVVSGQHNADGTEIRITAPVFFGNSGGGAWADDGCLIGITVSLVRSVEGSGYIVPADTLL
jgi:hypothetical protein